jgi:hypothetical protein
MDSILVDKYFCKVSYLTLADGLSALANRKTGIKWEKKKVKGLETDEKLKYCLK